MNQRRARLAEFVASYNEAVAQRKAGPEGVLLGLMQDFQAPTNVAFQRLAPSTKRSYVSIIKQLEKRFGDFPKSGLSDRRARHFHGVAR